MTHAGVNTRRLLMVLMAATLLFGLTAAVATQSASAAFPGGTGWIVFENDFDLYVVSADGGTPQATDTSLYNEVDPVFSPDGTKVAFARDFSGSAIWVAGFNSSTGMLDPTGSWVQVSSGPVDGEPTWSPDGSKIAYHRRIVSAVGSGGSNTVEDLTGVTLTDDDGPTPGTFVTDGVSAGDTVTNVRTGAKGTVTSITSETVLVMTGGLSGGSADFEWRVGDAYSIEHRSHRQLYYSNSNGLDQSGTALSADGWDDSYDDQNPAWSPDGDYIAFETTRGSGNANIYTLEFASPNTVLNLTDDIALWATRPNWSPDSAQVAFQSKHGGAVENIFRADAATGDTRVKVTDSGGDDVAPAWSPDGTEIAFRSIASGGLYAAPADSATPGTPRLIAADFGGNTNNEPDWQPVLTGVADAYEVDEGATLTVAEGDGVLVNDLFLVDDVGTTKTATSFTDPAHGDLTSNADGSFTYVHDDSETTSDSFTYVPAQGAFTGVATTVTLTINPVEDPVDPDPPTVSISGPSFGQIGEKVTFTSAITDGSGPVSYTWTVTRAGTAIPPVGTSATHSFTPALSGVYDVELVVVDDVGTDTANVKFTIMTDIADSVFVSDIVWLANEGITKGCNPPTNDQYCPDATVSRGQMAAFLVRFLGLTDIDPTIEFTDTASSIFEDDILKLATAGITRGCNADATEYCPNDSVTRGQMAAFLVRALNLTDDGGGDLFEDDDDSIFEGDIDRLATAGITRGCNPPANTNFCPTDTVTRGQMAAFLNRADGLR